MGSIGEEIEIVEVPVPERVPESVPEEQPREQPAEPVPA